MPSPIKKTGGNHQDQKGQPVEEKHHLCAKAGTGSKENVLSKKDAGGEIRPWIPVEEECGH